MLLIIWLGVEGYCQLEESAGLPAFSFYASFFFSGHQMVHPRWPLGPRLLQLMQELELVGLPEQNQHLLLRVL
jgi:hypothetical protein